ncbi:MAG: sensor histidine kinase [Acidobacteriota bacterium]
MSFFAATAAFWLLLALLMAIQDAVLSREEHLHYTFRTLWMLNSVRYFTVALLTPPLFWIVDRWPVTRATLSWRALAYCAGYVLFSLAFAVIRWLLFQPWNPETLTWEQRSLQGLIYVAWQSFAGVLMLYLSVVTGAHAYFYFTRSHRQEVEQLELQRALTESELQVLRAQIQPHFLFNTLQAISALTEVEPATARLMLAKLATLLRTALRYAASDIVPLSQELSFIEAYLDLEKTRLGDRLEVRWEISADVLSELVPQMILQPLVENSIKHGIACCRRPGWLAIEARREGDNIHLTVSNSTGEGSRHGLGCGLENTQVRLWFLYGEHGRFNFEKSVAGRAVADLVFPSLWVNEPAIDAGTRRTRWQEAKHANSNRG